MTSARILLATCIAALSALTLAACSSNGPAGTSSTSDGSRSSSSASAEFNDQDVMFVQMMRPHHEQAVQMADIILAKEGISSEVTDLAQQIKDEQGPEITQLDEWITAWDVEEVMSGSDHDMDGMMSDADMSALEGATGAKAETLFLEQMTMHHEGAVEMAQSEVDDGRNPDAIDLGRSIVETQSTEIDTMRDLLASR